MTKALHTPAPWAYDEDDARIYYDDGNVQPTIAYVERDGVAPEQVKVDGYIIAAAPELLEALKALLQWLAEFKPGVSFQVAEAAIAKATGGAS